MVQFDEVDQALDWLEAKPRDEILEVLKDFPGRPTDARQCVLAKFVQGTTGIPVQVTCRNVEDKNGAGLSVPLGPKLHQIRKEFDAKRHPDLIKKDST
jgi:hypothetical protein